MTMHRLIPILFLVACGSELEERRSQWDASGSDDYTMTVVRSCFCPDADPVDVVVVAGEIVSAIRQVVDGPAVTLDPADYADHFTVPGLFAIVEEAEQDADEVTIAYDLALGFPADIDIDWLKDAIDDEASIVVTNLTLTE